MPSVSGSGLCVSSASTGSHLYNFLSSWLSTQGVEEIQAVIKMESDSGYCQISPGYQLCDNPDGTLQTPVQFGTGGASNQSLSADGVDYPPSDAPWDDVSSSTDDYQFIRFGLMVQNDSGTNREFCIGSIKVNYRKKNP